MCNTLTVGIYGMIESKRKISSAAGLLLTNEDLAADGTPTQLSARAT